jgi:hypothetical protein
MEYRNDLEAARLRINTLEAKLEESKASLEARDAELAEYRTERDRLRQTSVQPPRKRLFAYVTVAFLAGILASVGTMLTLPTFANTTSPSTTVKGEGPIVEGPTNIPPEEPPTPKAREEGHILVPPQEPQFPPATVAGPTTEADPEGSTIASVIEGARPKIQAVFRDEVKRHPTARGNITVVFDIEPSGKVARAKLETFRFVEPWWSKTFDACVVGVYRNLTFPNTGGTKTTANGKYFLSALDLGF